MIGLLSINVSAARTLLVPEYDTQVLSGINKLPVEGRIVLNKLGFDGDEQADLSAHGGLDKAVYAYPVEHFPFWQKHRAAALGLPPTPLLPGGVGENLTLCGLLEPQVWVGDRLQIGSVLLEVTEPRQPCFKFNAHMGFNHAVRLMVRSGYTGFYLRVVETGIICCSDPITLLPGPREVAITQINGLRSRSLR